MTLATLTEQSRDAQRWVVDAGGLAMLDVALQSHPGGAGGTAADKVSARVLAYWAVTTVGHLAQDHSTNQRILGATGACALVVRQLQVCTT